jgi:hypothetical protein
VCDENTLNEIKGRFDILGNKIRELEDIAIEAIHRSKYLR